MNRPHHRSSRGSACAVGRAVVALALAGVGLAGCGSSAGTSGLPAAGPSGPTTAGPINGAGAGWPAFLHGPSHYGAATAVGPQTASVRWQRKLAGPIVPGPVITAAGVAYVASDGGVLHAIDIATGHDRWSFDGGGTYGIDLSTAPLVLPDGDVLWPGPRHMLFALTASGKQLWTLPEHADLVTPVLDATQHLLVVGDQAGNLSGYRLTTAAQPPTPVWSRHLASISYGSPAVAADGTIYQTAGKALFAVSPAGAIRWKVTAPKSIEVSPAVADGGIVVFGANDQNEYGVNPDGHLRWRTKIGNFTYSSPLALPGRRVIFGNHIGQMTTLNSDTGKLIRRDQAAGQLWTAAAVDSRGDAYFASRLGHVFGFTAGGRQLFDLNTGGQYDSYPALAPDGTLLIGSDDGTLTAIK